MYTLQSLHRLAIGKCFPSLWDILTYTDRFASESKRCADARDKDAEEEPLSNPVVWPHAKDSYEKNSCGYRWCVHPELTMRKTHPRQQTFQQQGMKWLYGWMSCISEKIFQEYQKPLTLYDHHHSRIEVGRAGKGLCYPQLAWVCCHQYLLKWSSQNNCRLEAHLDRLFP